MKIIERKLFELSDDSWRPYIEESWGGVVALERISASNVIGYSNAFVLNEGSEKRPKGVDSVIQPVSDRGLTQVSIIFDAGVPGGRIEKNFKMFHIEALDKIMQIPKSQTVSALIFSLNLDDLFSNEDLKVEFLVRDVKGCAENKISLEIFYGDTTQMDEIEKKLTKVGLIGKDITNDPSYFYENMVEFKGLKTPLKRRFCGEA